MSHFLTSEHALLALRHRLYVPGWGLRSALQEAAIKPELYMVELAYEQDLLVGVMVARHSRYNGCVNGKMPEPSHRRLSRSKAIGVQIFVRKAYRRRGHASTLLAKAHNCLESSRLRAQVGTVGSKDFWLLHDVRPWACSIKTEKSKWNYG